MDKRVGVLCHRPTQAQELEMLVRAEEVGVPTGWLVNSPTGPDALTLLAAAAVRTKRIRLGTAIVPTFTRVPIVMAQQAGVVAGLAPGRFVLGVGPSHKHVVEYYHGIPFERPLEHLREYVTIVRALLEGGQVDYDGTRLHAHAQLDNPGPVPVMISALRPKSYRLAGEVADGAIAYISPAPYLGAVALQALREGAAQANRAVPPLVGHVFLAVAEDADEVMRVVRERFAVPLAIVPFYAQMLVAAGFPEAGEGEWSSRMLDAVTVHGVEREVAAGLRSFLDTSGASELAATIVPVGPDEEASIERALRLVASL